MEKNINSKLVKKLNKTANRIRKARKNLKSTQEATEIEEIHKLLQNIDSNLTDIPESKSIINEPVIKSSQSTSFSPFQIKYFNDELLFSLFKEEDCLLKNFIDHEEISLIFGENNSLPSEECFRKFIAYHVTETLLPEEHNCNSLSLYVLYLMSVHHDPEFVADCFDFLKDNAIPLHPEDIFPILINFGAEKESFGFSEEPFLKRFQREEENVSKAVTEFSYFNLEMVGEILLYYITGNYVVINPKIKTLVKSLVRIALDPKIRAGSLLPLFSTVLTVLCRKVEKEFQLEEILSWVHSKEDHLLTQVEICRIVSKLVFPKLHEALVLATISHILKLDTLPTGTPIEIECIKTVLKELKRKELPPLEIYCIFQLVNGSLPGITATANDSWEISTILASLDRKLSRIEDSFDLIRLQFETAKARNLVLENASDRVTLRQKSKCSPAKKMKCSK